jgi:CheY-like chemotaxis protein
MILGDPTQVHQILLNLCLNARDAMPKGGNLTVTFENCFLDKHAAAMEPQARSGRFVRVTVTDTGTGIKSDVLKKIFEPFYTTKAVGRGTGLGLSTVMALVKSHGGHAHVYSEPGKGSTFKIYIPAIGTSIRARQRPAKAARLPRGNRQTILVVDDEAPIRKITQKTLMAFGYEVLLASNGAQALSIYSKHKDKISVVITDMGMPKMDGDELIRILSETKPNLKIIATTGLLSKDRLTKSFRGKVKFFLRKPYTAETLLKTLRATLRPK